MKSPIKFPQFNELKFTQFALRFLLSESEQFGYSISQSGQTEDLHKLLDFLNLHSSDENIVICAPSLPNYNQTPLSKLYQDSKNIKDISVLVIEFVPIFQYYELISNVSMNNPNVFKIFFFK